MADALKIIFNGDASQFNQTLAQVESDLKKFRADLKTATGQQLVKLNFDIAGLETTKSQILEFGKFAEGSLGALNQQINELNRQKLNLPADASALAPINILLDELITKRNLLNKAGLTIDTKPAEDSIAGLELKIKDLTEQRDQISIGANPSEVIRLNQELLKTKTELTEISKIGVGQEIVEAVRPAANSIAGLRLRIQELNAEKILIDPQINPSAIVKVNKEIDLLEDKVANLNNLGSQVGGSLPNAFGQVAQGGNQARIALTSLSLVAQDLPFGFIAIQNNLPAVISSFGALRATATTTTSVMSSLGTALAGPAGLFLAFSAVTGAVTYAVQKYGSLSEAVDAFIGKQNYLNVELKKAAETLAEYNEGLVTNEELIRKQTASTQSNVTKIKALAGIVTDTSRSLNERKAALKDLQKIDNDYFGALNIEKLNYNELKNALDTYNKSLEQSAISKGFQDRLSGANKELEAQDILLEKLRKRIDELKSAPIKITAAGTIDKTDINNATSAYNAQKVIVDALRKDQANYQNQLERSINTENGLKAPILAAAEAYRKKQEELKKAASQTTQAVKSVKELNIAELERQGRIAAFKLEEQAYKNRLKAVEDNVKAEQKLFDEIEQRFKQDAADANRLTLKVSVNANIEKVTIPLKEIQDLNEGVIEILNKGLDLKPAFDNAIKNLLNFSEYTKQEVEKISKNFRFLQEPLEGLFNTVLEDGKVSWKSFADDVIKQIKRIAAALLSKAIIKGIANILAPGSGAIVSAGLKGISTEGLGSYLDGNDWVDLFSGGSGSANFGGIRGNNAMNMAGQVNMVIRGNDLVGVMNRTNTTINRVG